MKESSPQVAMQLQEPREYIIVSDYDSKVLHSTPDNTEAITITSMIRGGGGSVTVFVATKI